MSASLLNTKYELVCGLEVHIQLNTKSKAFCADLNEYGSIPNTNIGVYSLGHPGTLPKLNERSINSAILLGLATKSEITPEMFFARKNYAEYKELMHRAQSLVLGEVLKIKMCEIAARSKGFQAEDIHGFVEMVPMGDAEIVRLQNDEGHAYMR